MRDGGREWSVGQMIPFRYGGFWDVPRYILLRYRGKPLLLESPFDENLDEYPDDFAVYELPSKTERSADTRTSWIPEGTQKPSLVVYPSARLCSIPLRAKPLMPIA